MARRKADSVGWFDQGVDFVNRMIYFGSLSDPEENEAGIDHRVSENVIKSLIALDLAAPDGDKPITIIMNSIGGDVYHGLAIYDAIKSCRNEVVIMVYGAAFSMAAVVLQAADKRIMAPNARLMIHYGEEGSSGHSKSVLRWAREGQKQNKIMEDMLLARMNQKDPKFSRENLTKLLDFDTILSAREAVSLGLADAILGENAE